MSCVPVGGDVFCLQASYGWDITPLEGVVLMWLGHCICKEIAACSTGPLHPRGHGVLVVLLHPRKEWQHIQPGYCVFGWGGVVAVPLCYQRDDSMFRRVIASPRG